MARALFVIAPSVFRDEEYSEPKAVLEAAGIRCDTASTTRGVCTGKLGMSAIADYALSEVSADDYDAVVFVGGAGAQVYFDDPDAHRLARDTVSREAVLAAICIAPSILARAGLLEGRKVTAFPSQETDLVAHKAIFTAAPVQIDERIITANGPNSAQGFGRVIVEALGYGDRVSSR